MLVIIITEEEPWWERSLAIYYWLFLIKSAGETLLVTMVLQREDGLELDFMFYIEFSIEKSDQVLKELNSRRRLRMHSPGDAIKCRRTAKSAGRGETLNVMIPYVEL